MQNAYCAIIPAYNAEKKIGEVVSNLAKYLPNSPIVVINDGSTDFTNRIVQRYKVIYIEHTRNKGKGRALKSGFQIARAINSFYIFTLDADGQHDPRDVVTFQRDMNKKKLDMLIGSRMSNPTNMPLHRMLSNRLTSKLISWRINANVEDSQSGYRLICHNVLENLKLNSNRFEIESETIIKAADRGFKIGFTKIKSTYSTKNSNIKFIDIFCFIRLFVKSFLWKKRCVAQFG